MGYTHYWRQHFDFEDAQWLDIMEAAKLMLYESDIPLEHVVICLDYIAFNGVGADGHETCYIWRIRDEAPPDDLAGFGFCKTARKPYDAVVVEFLKMVREVAGDMTFKLSSDGGPEVFA